MASTAVAASIALVAAGCSKGDVGGGSSSAGGSSSPGGTIASGGGGTVSSSGGGGGTGGKGVANVVWWNMWSGATVAITKQMVSEFNATHPKIHVTQLNVPSADGDAKLLSAVAAGDPPDVFTEWNPTIGEYAQTGAIESLSPYLTGKYKGFEKWMYPVVLQGGVYKGQLYGASMSMGTLALYYNKSLMKAAGIASPPKTLGQLYADQAKEWKISGGRVSQIGFYPLTSPMYEYMSYFGVKAYNHGRYDLASNPKALAMAKWLATYDKYPYSGVSAMDSAYGSVGGGSEDPFDMGKAGFWLSGAWEGVENIPPDNPSLKGHFGVEPFPPVPGGATSPSSYVWGNYNVIPKGAKNPRAAFTFISWLTGYDNVSTIAKLLPKGGWIPAGPAPAAAPAYKSWLASNSYVKPLVDEMAGKDSQQVALTPAESEYETAVTQATQFMATKKMTPEQALAYIDKQANAALHKK